MKGDKSERVWIVVLDTPGVPTKFRKVIIIVVLAIWGRVSNGKVIVVNYKLVALFNKAVSNVLESDVIAVSGVISPNEYVIFKN